MLCSRQVSELHRPSSGNAACDDGADLTNRRRNGQHEQGGADGDASPQTVRTKSLGHAPYGLCDDGNCNDLETVDRT